MFRQLKALTYTKCENLVRDLTADSDTNPDQSQLAELATYTLSGRSDQYTKILAMLSKRMTDYPKIKHVKKSLMVIDYGLTNFSDKFVSDLAQQQSVIQRITKYRYYKNGETDIAGPVRELAASILIKLSEDEIEDKRGYGKKQATGSPPQPAVPAKQEEEEVEAADEPNREEPKATEAMINAVKFDEWDDGSIQVSGRVGINEGRVNGIYAPRGDDQMVGGKRSYIKEGQMEDPIVMWFWEKNRGVWMISRETGINSDSAYACVLTGMDVETPDQIPGGKTWMVYNKAANDGKGGYEPDKNITVTLKSN